jgi:hypothetical protein
MVPNSVVAWRVSVARQTGEPMRAGNVGPDDLPLNHVALQPLWDHPRK